MGEDTEVQEQEDIGELQETVNEDIFSDLLEEGGPENVIFGEDELPEQQ